MSIIEILLVLVVIGVALYLANRFIPMAAPVKVILNAIVVLGLIAWLLHAFGLVPLPRSLRHLW